MRYAKVRCSCGSDQVKPDYVNLTLTCKKCKSVIRSPEYYKAYLAEKTFFNPQLRLFKYRYPSDLLTKEERALRPVLGELCRLDSMLSIPTYIKREMVRLYRKLYQSKYTNGRDKRVVLCALLYILSRDNSLFYLMDDLAFASCSNSKSITKQVKRICRVLNKQLASIDTSSVIIRLSYECGLKPDEISNAIDICERKGHFIRHMLIKCVACVYISSNKRIDLIKICDRTNTSVDSVLRVVKRLC